MELSIFLAQLMGIWVIVGSVAAIVSRDQFKRAAKEITKHTGLLMSIAAIETLLGLMIVLSHPIWEGWPMVITIIGWLMVLEGIIYLFSPETFKRFKDMLLEDKFYYITAIICLALGAFLTYQGFWA